MAPNVKDVTFEVVSQNDDGTYTVRQTSGGGSSPYAGGGSSPNLPAVVGGGYTAMVNGRKVTFASEADAEVAGVAINELRGGGGVRELVNARSGARQDPGSSGGAQFLRGGANAADAITAFFRGRNLRQKRDDLNDALAARAKALDTVRGLQQKYPELISAFTAYAAAESDVNATAIGILDDQILGVDVQAGTGVARVMADLWDGMGRGGMGGGEGFSTLAAGGLGIGVGMLLASRSPSSSSKY